jgi:NADPH:quinone reductase-like Zn-dependent oxidoreductase
MASAPAEGPARAGANAGGVLVDPNPFARANRLLLMSTLSGKTAIVVGASSGVGRATAKRLVSAGANVVAVARSLEGLDRLRAETSDRIRR